MTITKLQLLDTATSKGEGDMYEDLAGGVGPYAWMFDGATDMPATYCPQPHVTGAYWLAHHGDAWLSRHASDQEPHTLLSDLAAAVDAALHDRGMPDGALPPATSLAIAHVTENRLEAAVVGDVAVYNVTHKDLLLDARFGTNERTAVAQQVPANGSRPDREVRAAQVDGIVARRRADLAGRNGPWILGNNPAVGTGALRRTWPMARGDLVLLATDGFTRAVTDYDIATSWDDLADMILAHGIQDVIDHIRHLEAGLDRTMFFKKSDDACAALYRRA
ncbi:protein phosphatase 2C domain-containing protein [Myceligenerans pegani]|uniref:Protein phosphatase 2C domain-containing protein n=1 Tax=Myceligenerans pegani TaxID=2776917 RepID=A0ABR9N1E8_9MICO|nr:protein phosphatase 2C domain-containing protein [Myceligenerans sp. TRM 65318]MBE1877459.1 protein phosphatase 2C domain-containing protein [Myceligenerans sp. TRM 65318]MBE3019730.1 protein phosphatase 2C domain-containing protein [Myceligenerans sp. TRM 65318]